MLALLTYARHTHTPLHSPYVASQFAEESALEKRVGGGGVGCTGQQEIIQHFSLAIYSLFFASSTGGGGCHSSIAGDAADRLQVVEVRGTGQNYKLPEPG